MKRSLALLLASSAAAALIAACSAAPETGGLGSLGKGSSQGPAAGTASGSSSTATGDGSGNGAAPGSGSSTPSSGPSTPLQPPPASGPGSTSSAAHQFFDSNVYPKLSVCTACHSSGADGAPKMMEAPADTTYSELDSLGLIQSNSMLLTHGVHDSGKAPALTSDQTTVIQQWLAMEAQERQGQAAPTNVLADIAKCVDENLWNQIGWSNLKTTPRTNENPNRCTGCNNVACRDCHGGGEAGFFMDEGSRLDPAGTTFKETFQGSGEATFVLRYFGLNGTSPVASNGIMLKQTAVAAAPPYSHPMFTMSTTMQTALDAFVKDALTKYQNKTCTGTGPAPADAGTD